jgi:hypothetical protein
MRLAREAPRGAENWLAHILEINRHAMAQKGVAADLMQAELRALETAIRAHLWYLVVGGDGAA